MNIQIKILAEQYSRIMRCGCKRNNRVVPTPKPKPYYRQFDNKRKLDWKK